MRISVQRRWDSRLGEPGIPIVIQYNTNTVSGSMLKRGITYMFQSTTDCHIAHGATPVADALTCVPLSANIPYLLTFKSDVYIAAIKKSSPGRLFMTPMFGGKL